MSIGSATMYLYSLVDSPMTPDAVNHRKRPRWFSPRGAMFWILAPAVVIAAAFAVLMFWPGLTYDWLFSTGMRRKPGQWIRAAAPTGGLMMGTVA